MAAIMGQSVAINTDRLSADSIAIYRESAMQMLENATGGGCQTEHDEPSIEKRMRARLIAH